MTIDSTLVPAAQTQVRAADTPRPWARLHQSALKTLAALAVGAAAWAPAQGQDRFEVDQAREALARGAVVWDLRPAGEVLPGAARIAPQALQAWLERGDHEVLSRAVSAVGLNLSAEVVLVADDDTSAQTVADRLRPLARGRLAWLAGGVVAWRAAGLPLDAAPTVRLPMPQRLMLAAPVLTEAHWDAAPADAARRATVTVGVALPTLAAGHAPLPSLR